MSAIAVMIDRDDFTLERRFSQHQLSSGKNITDVTKQALLLSICLSFMRLIHEITRQ
jgi:hypothetical protein